MSKYDIIIFDFDGVILNSHKEKSNLFYKIFNNFGERVGNKALNFHLKNTGITRIKKFDLINKMFLKQSLSKIDLSNIELKFKQNIYKKISNMKININLLNFLKKNSKKKLYISTGTNQKEIEIICKKKKIYNYFRDIYGSPVNKIEHIELIKLKNNFNKKKNIVFIGDSYSDYIAAKKTNVDFICKSNSENFNLRKNFNIQKIYTFKQLFKIIY